MLIEDVDEVLVEEVGGGGHVASVEAGVAGAAGCGGEGEEEDTAFLDQAEKEEVLARRRKAQAAEAMELGADAVLVNTALAVSREPASMGEAFGLGVRAGRQAYLAGLGEVSGVAQATSPLTAFLDQAES